MRCQPRSSAAPSWAHGVAALRRRLGSGRGSEGARCVSHEASSPERGRRRRTEEGGTVVLACARNVVRGVSTPAAEGVHGYDVGRGRGERDRRPRNMRARPRVGQTETRPARDEREQAPGNGTRRVRCCIVLDPDTALDVRIRCGAYTQISRMRKTSKPSTY